MKKFIAKYDGEFITEVKLSKHFYCPLLTFSENFQNAFVFSEEFLKQIKQRILDYYPETEFLEIDYQLKK